MKKIFYGILIVILLGGSGLITYEVVKNKSSNDNYLVLDSQKIYEPLSYKTITDYKKEDLYFQLQKNYSFLTETFVDYSLVRDLDLISGFSFLLSKQNSLDLE
ncbi:hypothetical protein [Mycoplasma buteonis]|uniref:hypothetical protein n=1 Tax=Mycoplasma buteonis TaxID=171280 RepID=UPI0005641300|nr:hypothetical protein [Mycoplasma buteonis]